MPISVSTFAADAVIDAGELRARSLAIEQYVNGEIAAGDRTTNWVTSGHVYGPDFQYGTGYDAHLPFTGGHAHWSKRPNDDGRRAIFEWAAGNTATMVPGLTRTVQLPEALSTRYYALVMASFWVFEYGGWGKTPPTLVTPFQDESTSIAARVLLYADGVAQTATQRYVYNASCATNNGGSGSGGADEGASSGLIYCRKQVSMVYPLSGTVWSGAGVHTVGVGVEVNLPVLTGGTHEEWRHVFVREGSIYVRYRLR